MPLQDTTSIPGQYNQVIVDWALADDRILTGQVTGLPATDPNCIAAYFTLKADPTDNDADALLQKRITQIAQASGQITQVPANNLLFHIYAGDFPYTVNAGTEYYWDVRIVTTGGITWTVATGMVQFIQNSTQTDAAGVPFVQSNLGSIPTFRGFINDNPNNIIGYNLVDVLGDFYFNSAPQPGAPSGWACIASGGPGTWVSMGITGNPVIPGPPQTPPLSPRGGGLPIIRGFIIDNPANIAGYMATDIQGDVFFNLNPQPGAPSGWVCTASGTPVGSWASMGITGNV